MYCRWQHSEVYPRLGSPYQATRFYPGGRFHVLLQRRVCIVEIAALYIPTYLPQEQNVITCLGLWLGVLWRHRRPSSSIRMTVLGWGLPALPDWLAGGWSSASVIRLCPLVKGPVGRRFAGTPHPGGTPPWCLGWRAGWKPTSDGGTFQTRICCLRALARHPS